MFGTAKVRVAIQSTRPPLCFERIAKDRFLKTIFTETIDFRFTAQPF